MVQRLNSLTFQEFPKTRVFQSEASTQVGQAPTQVWDLDLLGRSKSGKRSSKISGQMSSNRRGLPEEAYTFLVSKAQNSSLRKGSYELATPPCLTFLAKTSNRPVSTILRASASIWAFHQARPPLLSNCLRFGASSHFCPTPRTQFCKIHFWFPIGSAIQPRKWK